MDSALRAAGLAVGILLGAGGIWMLITATTTKDTRIGAVISAWGLFFALSALFGRRSHEAAAGVEASGVPGSPGAEVVRREAAGLTTLGDAQALRDYEQRLHSLLRQEIQQTLGAELAALRHEVSALRSDVVENVGGRLRLERIETTRVIGSDIEALQREVNQLKRSQVGDEYEPARTAPSAAITVDAEVVEQSRPAPQRPVSDRELTAQIPPVRDTAPAPPVATPAPPPAAPAAPPAAPAATHDAPAAPRAPAGASYWQAVDSAAEPEPAVADFVPAPPAADAPPAEPVATSPVPVPVPSPAPAAAGPDPNDPFASLPRIRPFTDFDLDPVEAAATATSHGEQPATHVDNGDSPSEGGGRRRRAENDEGDDVLARILQRERGR